MSCGLCLNDCPTYRILGDEADSPRGRIHLIRDLMRTTSAPDPSALAHIDACLVCRACETACPSLVPFGRIMEGAREEIAHRRPPGRARALLIDLVTRPRLLAAAALLAAVYDRTARRLVRRILPRRLAEMDALVPVAEGAPYRPAPRADADAQLFAGCVMRACFGDTQRATVRVLERSGLRVGVPEGQGCCGALHAHAGLGERSRELARANIAAFAGSDGPIAVTAAGCGAHLRAYGELVGGEDAHRFAARVRDASEVATAGGARGGAGRPLRVVYQDACHLAHGQRVRREPRDLLRAVEGIEVVPIADPERCCGSAGVYNLTHPEVARELQQRKVRAILAARPDVVVSANPGCILQIRAGLDEAGARLPVVHLMRFIDDPAASPVRSRPSRHPPVPSATGSAGRAKIGPPMSVSRSTYRHRLSSEDVRKSRILITKDAWKLFPEPGERVALRIGARSFDAEIKAERCECVPPAHEHYHLTCAALKGQAGFKSGALVVIAKDSVGGYRFVEERG